MGKVRLRVPLLSIAFISIIYAICSCDDVTSTYSKRELVNCNYVVTSYSELFNVMGNYGQFASIRQTGNGKIRMTLASTGKYTDYNPDKIQQYFQFGLGGLIVGTDNYGQALCYDLACPYCDISSRRLTLGSQGYAKCDKCGITYDMNNLGVIISTDSTKIYNQTPRGLYRYRITYNGSTVSMYN